jgi:hypothetical protein
MLGLVPLAGLLFLSGEFGAYAGLIAEGRVGRDNVPPAAPPQGTAPPPTTGTNTDLRWTVAGVLTPIGELQVQNPTRQVLLDYRPRFWWQQPNPYQTGKTLILHTADLSATVDATPNVRLIERASSSYGEADYETLKGVFLQQGTLPPVAKIFALSAGTGFRWDADRIWRYETMLDFEHRRTLEDAKQAQMVDPNYLFQQTNLVLDSVGIARLSRRDDLVLSAGVSDRRLNENIEVFAVTPQVGWRTRFARRLELRMMAGLTYAHDLGTTGLVHGAGTQLPGSAVSPVGGVELNGLFLGRRGVTWRGTTGLTLDYFVDPYLRLAGPRAIFFARSQVLFEPNWTVGLEGSLSTSLREGDKNYNPDETTVDVALPVRHLVSRHVIVEAGLRLSARAPRIRANDVTFHTSQNWLYVSVAATSRLVERWQAPPELSTEARDEGVFARVQTTDARPEPADTVPTNGPAKPQPTNAVPP